MSKFVRHDSCPKCGSSDNLARYEDGSSYCFTGESCGYFETADDKNNNSDEFVSLDYKKIQSGEIDLGVPADLPSRKISKGTCEKFHYNIKGTNGTTVQVANFVNDEGYNVAQKVRTKDKHFYWLGKPSEAGLFGQHLWNPNKKLSLVICEGEIDALSIAEVQECNYPVVSVTKGAAGAFEEIKKNLEWCSSFANVVLCFDNDEVGRVAAKKCADLFEPGKCKIAELSEKDANEMLCKDKIPELLTSLVRAKEYRPDGIVSMDDLSNEFLLKPDPYGYTSPFPKLDSLIRGVKARRLYLVAAGSGLGKSTFVKEIGYHLITQHNVKIANVFLEEGLQETAMSYVAIDNNMEITELLENPQKITQDQLNKSKEKFKKRLFYYDHSKRQLNDNDFLINKLRYFMVGLDCDIVILDHISLVFSGQESSREGERKDIDLFMTKLRALIQETGKSVVAIVHLKRKKEAYNEGARVSLSDMRGSGSLEQLSDFVIALERNQFGDEPNVSHVKVLKCRKGGRIGYADDLEYSFATGRLEPIETGKVDEDSDF